MKSQVPVLFGEWLDLMDGAYQLLSDKEFRELEDKIIKEIKFHRKNKKR